MRRRRLLAAAGAGLLAGCTLDPVAPDDREARSVFEGQPCQRVIEETTCYHTARDPPAADDVVLVPEDEELPGGGVDTTFELYNGLDGPYHFARHVFLRRIGGRWQIIPFRPHDGNVTARRVPRGERVTLDLERPAVDTYTSYGGEVPLGGGTFACVVLGVPGSGPPRFASAYFRVAGEPLELGVPDWVAVETDGATATARRTDRGPADADVVVRFEVVSRNADFGTPVSPEFGSRRWELGVGLALLGEGAVAAVEVRTDDEPDPPFTEWLEYAAHDPATGAVDPSADYPVLSYRGTAFSVARRFDPA